MNGATSVLKSVLCLVLDKDRNSDMEFNLYSLKVFPNKSPKRELNKTVSSLNLALTLDGVPATVTSLNIPTPNYRVTAAC